MKLFRGICWLLAFLRRYVLWIVLWITTQVKFHSLFSYFCFCILKRIKFRICQTEIEKFHLKHSCAIVNLGNIWNCYERHFFALKNSAKFRMHFFFSIGYDHLRLFCFSTKFKSSPQKRPTKGPFISEISENVLWKIDKGFNMNTFFSLVLLYPIGFAELSNFLNGRLRLLALR